MSGDCIQELKTFGRCWFRRAVPEAELAALEHACAIESGPGARVGWSAGIETGLGASSTLHQLSNLVLPGAEPVRLVVFSKSPASNWLVPWHQDRVVAVDRRHDITGYSSWARKAGVWHCEPPIETMASMVFARVHFDRSDQTNGCLELALGTHALGAIPAGDADQVARNADTELCVAERGDVLFVNALTLHRSKTSEASTRRRTLRVDYANRPLATPLGWALAAARAHPAGT